MPSPGTAQIRTIKAAGARSEYDSSLPRAHKPSAARAFSGLLTSRRWLDGHRPTIVYGWSRSGFRRASINAGRDLDSKSPSDPTASVMSRAETCTASPESAGDLGPPYGLWSVRHSERRDLSIRCEDATCRIGGAQQLDRRLLVSSIRNQGHDDSRLALTGDFCSGLFQGKGIPEDPTHRADSQERENHRVGETNGCRSAQAPAPPLPGRFRRATLGILREERQIHVSYDHVHQTVSGGRWSMLGRKIRHLGS